MATEPSRLRASARLPLLMILVASLFSALLTTAPPAVTPAAAAPGFDDVPDGVWYSDAVAWLAATEITTGTSETTFSPAETVTRAQMAAFIARYLQTEGEPGGHGFDDVPAGAYYDGPVSVLVDRGITTGTSDTTYSPGDVVTRKQMATFLYRLAGEPPSDAANPFVDNPAGTWWYDAVRWLFDRGITTGTTDTTFSPDDVVTRAQMATFLWRLAGEPDPDELGTNRVDEDTTVVAEEADVEFTMLSETGESEIEWQGDDVPETGDIVALDATEETPDGFLGKVVEVDGDTVVTEPAVLEEVVADGEFVVDMSLEENQEGLLALQGLLEDVFEDPEMGCGGSAGITVTAGLGVEPWLTLEGSWSPGDGVEAAVGFGVTITADITAEVGGAINCSAAISTTPKELKPIKFWVGSIPVWIEPEISFFGEISASFTAEAGVAFVWEETVGVTVEYAQGTWGVVYDAPGDAETSLDPFFGGEAVLDIQIGARLDMLVYGRGGPYATLGPFFTVTAQIDDPWWAIDAGLRASVGASFDLWFWEGEVQFAEIDLLRYRLADAETAGDPFPGDDDPDFDFVAPGIAQPTDIAMGRAAMCTIIAGIVECVGLNDEGQLGDGTQTNRSSLVSHGRETLNDGTPLNAIEVQMDSNQGCALYDDGSLRCWGDVPRGSTTSDYYDDPRIMSGLNQPVRTFEVAGSPSPGFGAVCVVLEDFTARCWGDEYATESSYRPRQSPRDPGLASVVDVAVTGTSRCFVIADGTVECWGNNSRGQLGDGTETGRNELAPIPGLTDVKELEAGSSNFCALHYDGTVSCWGYNRYAQIGNGTYGIGQDTSVPAKVLGIDDAVAVEMGRLQTCVVHESGDLSCWGYDPDYQLMGQPGDYVTTPVTLIDVDLDAGDPAVVAVDIGSNSSCVLYADKVSKCWGNNFYGQLGNNNTTTAYSPQTVRNAPV
ncbi:MAG: S-layer homology domain-containing protein [Actinomycetota bacterium]